MQGVDETNDVLQYQCSALETVGTSNDTSGTNTTGFASIETPPFTFTSRPGAPYSLWLDFAGSVITNTGELLVQRSSCRTQQQLQPLVGRQQQQLQLLLMQCAALHQPHSCHQHSLRNAPLAAPLTRSCLQASSTCRRPRWRQQNER
jgi:hypothetical protein